MDSQHVDIYDGRPRPRPVIAGAAADRAVLADDGEHLVLTLFHGDARVAALGLSPRRALALAGELLAAGLRALDRDMAAVGGPDRRSPDSPAMV